MCNREQRHGTGNMSLIQYWGNGKKCPALAQMHGTCLRCVPGRYSPRLCTCQRTILHPFANLRQTACALHHACVPHVMHIPSTDTRIHSFFISRISSAACQTNRERAPSLAPTCSEVESHFLQLCLQLICGEFVDVRRPRLAWLVWTEVESLQGNWSLWDLFVGAVRM